MTGEELKQSILQMAIQGKLVPQDPENDEPAWKLLERIKEEKDQLIKEKKIKKEKPLPPISEEEKPFEIPANWEWVRLGEVGFSIRGNGIKRSEVVESSFYPCIRYGELYTTYLGKITSVKSYTTKDVYDKSKKATYGCILMALTGENNYDIALARPYVGKELIAYGGDMTAYFPIKINSLYLTLILNSSYGISQKRERATGNIVVHISNDKLFTIPIPLPPLEEQKRIVAKLEELQPLIDRYTQLEQKLSKLNKEFPQKLKESILQDAIQGKLTEQDYENDEPAWKLLERIKEEKEQLIKEKKIKREKPLPPISQEEKPFEIPNNWEWMRLGETGFSIRGSGIKRLEIVKDSIYHCIRYGELYTTYLDKITAIESSTTKEVFDKSKKATYGCIFMALTGENNYDIALARPYMGKEIIAYGGDMTAYFPIKVDFLYLTVVLNSKYGITQKRERATGNIVVHLSNDKLATIPIPFPPLEEQKRIVEKLEEFQSMINKLNQRISKSK